VRQGRVGAMLQTGGLPPDLRAKELVAFVRGLHARRGRRLRPLSDLWEATGCAEFADRPVERLSGGQAQRLRFAMAISGEPELLFLDEPTAGLDIEARRRFWTAVRAFAATGRTVLFATHYLAEADAFAGRVVVLLRGRIVADGTPAAIKARAGGRTVQFSLPGAGADPSVRRALEALPGVVAVAVEGDAVRLRTTDADATVRAALLSGLPLRGLEIGGADLEEAFLALVNERADPEEAAGR
jgi:ABC-2 type transport system ATP-binding protein